MEEAKRPVTALAGGYGHPAHPALVAVPVGAWVASFAFDVASHVTSDPATATSLATGSRWLIGLGVVAAVVAALLGFLDLLGLPPGTRVFRTAIVHMSLMLTVVAGYAAGFALRGADPVAPVPAGPLVLSAATLAALGVGGYLGGMLAYRYGVRVADEHAQADGYRPLSTPVQTTSTNPKEES